MAKFMAKFNDDRPWGSEILWRKQTSNLSNAHVTRDSVGAIA